MTANALVETRGSHVDYGHARNVFGELRAAKSPLLPHASVRRVVARDPKPEESAGYYDPRQLWSDRAFQKLKELYPDGGPDIASPGTTSERELSRCRRPTPSTAP